LHSRPGLLDLADVEGVGIAARRQEGAAEIALHRRGVTIAEDVYPLAERLFDVFCGGVVELRKCRLARVDFDDTAAGSRRLADAIAKLAFPERGP
jgi:hypothetical protein